MLGCVGRCGADLGRCVQAILASTIVPGRQRCESAGRRQPCLWTAARQSRPGSCVALHLCLGVWHAPALAAWDVVIRQLSFVRSAGYDACSPWLRASWQSRCKSTVQVLAAGPGRMLAHLVLGLVVVAALVRDARLGSIHVHRGVPSCTQLAGRCRQHSTSLDSWACV